MTRRALGSPGVKDFNFDCRSFHKNPKSLRLDLFDLQARTYGRSANLTTPRKFRRIYDYEPKGERPVTHAIRFHKTGGPEVLQWEEVQVGRPGPGEARVRNTAVGLNYVDTYFRSGHYPAPLPSGLGAEGAGVVEEVGPGVIEVKPGDRVAYGNGPQGAYSEAR